MDWEFLTNTNNTGNLTLTSPWAIQEGTHLNKTGFKFVDPHGGGGIIIFRFYKARFKEKAL